MKKILVLASLVAGIAANAAVISTNLNVTGVTGGSTVFLLTTNRASTSSVIISSPSTCVISLYDCSSIASPLYGTNYTISANYTNMVTYPTNYTYSFIGNNGYTNWYTNSGVWTQPTTVTAGTYALQPIAVFPVAANTAVTYDLNATFSQGIAALCQNTTNTALVIYYKAGK